MILEEEEYLAHYGVARRSGRYPWGSGGEEDYRTYISGKRNKEFLDYVKLLSEDGLSESEIAQGLGMTTIKLRAAKSNSSAQERQANIAMAERLREKGTSTTEIGRRMEVPESTVRSWLAPGAREKASSTQNTANAIKANVDEKGFIDVGKGTENFLGVTRTKMDNAIALLEDQGYPTHLVKAPQATTSHETTMKVITPPGTTQREVFLNRDKIQQIQSFSDDGGKTFGGLHEPLSVDPKRISVKYKEDGGDKSDGMIYVRPGIEDISIGGSKYAQVRIAVGQDHYLKGMAIERDDLPDGVDIEFHTSKSKGGNKLDAMKKNSDEKGFVEDGPHVILKSVKRQILANPDTPNERVISAMNIVNEEGNWEKWSKDLSSQMLSKQNPTLARSQLNMTFERRENELESIKSLTNATVRKKLLNDFGDATDAAAVQLHAAALPHTAVHVLLPLSTIKATEVFAPNYTDGDTVVLVRHPHAGPFEIPRLTVNNKNREARRLLGESRDAIGIHHSVAQQLSGADFDGDAVQVIPDRATKIHSINTLDSLKNFNPREAYPGYDGMPRMKNTQTEIGIISNLITDMSLQNAPMSEVAKAVKHSMVVIDAEKHNLNHKLSYNDNEIKRLKKKYQTGGASTLISRAGAEVRIAPIKPRTRKHGGPINLRTGAKEFEPDIKLNAKGEVKPGSTKIERLALESDARVLMSSPTGIPMERIYATHANKMKLLANEARLAAIKTPTPKASPSAKKTYDVEVKSLNNKLQIAQRNAPLERQAQLIADVNYRARVDASPSMDNDTKKKIRYQALVQARTRTGAQKHRIEITTEEWNAIQAGAISDNKLQAILYNADMETVRQHATPKTAKLMTSSKTNRANQMLASGYSRAYVAQHMGVSLSTLDQATLS